MPSRITDAPRGIPFQGLVLKFGFRKPENEIIFVAFVGIFLYALADTNGKIIVTDDMNKAIDAVNIIATEHLEICVDDPFAVLNSVKNAGSIFLGKNVPEALVDYFAGPNHTLPTSGTARFSSPLGVDDFVKKSSFIYYTRDALEAVAPRIADFAEREGLHAHARSVTIRYEK